MTRNCFFAFPIMAKITDTLVVMLLKIQYSNPEFKLSSGYTPSKFTNNFLNWKTFIKLFV